MGSLLDGDVQFAAALKDPWAPLDNLQRELPERCLLSAGDMGAIIQPPVMFPRL